MAVVERALSSRPGSLTITLGTGCCESTAPFLFEDFWPGPDQEQIGEVAGVPVYAPEYLRSLYPGDEEVVVDVVEGVLAESLSIETEWECRLTLRGLGVDTGVEVCAVSTDPVEAVGTTGSPVGAPTGDRPGQRVRGELPAELRDFRMR